MKKKRKPARKAALRSRRIERGERVLSEVEKLTIVLENGRKATFDIDQELAVSADPDELHEQALQGHSRFAFWAYQATRALGKLRAAERKEAVLAADTYLRARAYLEDVRPKLAYIEGARVQALVDADKAVIEAREDVDSLREQWNMIAAVRDALEHRTHLLRRLLSQDRDAATRG